MGRYAMTMDCHATRTIPCTIDPGSSIEPDAEEQRERDVGCDRSDPRGVAGAAGVKGFFIAGATP
jgi:hypothetical protein